MSTPTQSKIVRTQKLGPGVTRYWYLDGGCTDICVCINGPLNFFGRREEALDEPQEPTSQGK